MLINREINVKWNPTTKKYYEQSGYTFTKYNDIFTVKIEHLHRGSNEYVDFICDCCNEKSSTKYYRYLDYNDKYNKDMCSTCLAKLRIETRKSKAKTITDFGYYSTHENRKVALLEYLLKYKVLSNMIQNSEGKRLYDNFYKHNDSIYETAKELGYRLEDICVNMPLNYYNDQIYIEKMNTFIREFGRFPNVSELQQDLRINNMRIYELGGINYFKKLVNYVQDSIIDNNGDYNRSARECMVANYLIDRGLKNCYLREQRPFPKEEGYFRSDFTLFPANQKPIHIEVWGFDENSVDERAIQYFEIKLKKLTLYDKHSIQVISLEDNIFRNKGSKTILDKLDETFKPYLCLKYITVK